MKKDTVQFIRETATHSSLGLSLGLCIVIGLGIGVFLDKKFGTDPWLTFIFLGFGIAAVYRNIWLAIERSRKM